MSETRDSGLWQYRRARLKAFLAGAGAFWFLFLCALALTLGAVAGEVWQPLAWIAWAAFAVWFVALRPSRK
jgi:hypothetical protein